MGKHFSDEQIEFFLKKAIEENPDTIDMYIKVFTKYAWDAIVEIKILTTEAGMITRRFGLLRPLEVEVGHVKAHKLFVEDLRRYFANKFPHEKIMFDPE